MNLRMFAFRPAAFFLSKSLVWGLAWGALLFLAKPVLASDPIGVVPFQTRGKVKKEMGESLAAHILVSLARSRRYTLVERGQLKRALEEIALSQSGAISAKEALKIGKQIGARYLILGELKQEDSDSILQNPSSNRPGNPTYEASLRVLKTETGVIVGADRARGTLAQIKKGLSMRARQLLGIYLAMDNPDSPYSILLKLDKGKNPVYKVGETLRLSFQVKKHRARAKSRVYIQIYSIDSRGAMTMIYPNKFTPGMQIETGRTYSFPSDSDDFEWALVPPTGTEYIQAIVTEKPVHFFRETRSYKSRAFPELRKRENTKTYRAIRVRIKKEKLKDWSAERITYTLKN